MIEERQAAVGAILKAGHIPAGMELFTAGDQAQMEIIKKWIDESDVYMLILGGRYGSLIPDSELSYTEWEYDYAVENGKPLFAVVIESEALEAKVRLKGTANTEGDNLKEWKKFKEKVLSKQSNFFSDNKDIRLCVSESLKEFSDRADLKGWISGSEVEDTTKLRDELYRLRDENFAMKNALLKAESAVKPALVETNTESIFKELSEILSAIKIDSPMFGTGTSKQSKILATNLLEFFHLHRDVLINGVTNYYNVTHENRFLYDTICPKLEVHGLVVNEQVAGERRRIAVTERGKAFLAYWDKNIHLSKSE